MRLILLRDNSIETERLWERLLNHEPVIGAVIENKTKSGDPVTCEWFVTPLTGEPGEIAGIAAMALDISDKKQNELAIAAQLDGDQSPLGQSIALFARIAAKTREADIGQEYHDLFIGLGRGELLPYASYYLTGFLNEKFLSRQVSLFKKGSLHYSPLIWRLLMLQMWKKAWV